SPRNSVSRPNPPERAFGLNRSLFAGCTLLEDRMGEVFLRFRDLKARGIVGNWTTLLRRIQHRGFPPGRLLGPKPRLERRRNRALAGEPARVSRTGQARVIMAMELAKRAVITVREGRGFVVEGSRGKLCVITAAHCLPELPPAHAASKTEERTY